MHQSLPHQIPNHILTQVNNKMSLAFFPFFAFSLCTSFNNVKYCYSYMKHAPPLTKEKETRNNGLVKQQELSSFILRFRYSGSTRPNLPWSLRVACPSRLARSCVLSFPLFFFSPRSVRNCFDWQGLKNSPPVHNLIFR